ncbi:unnamed protein product [Adineta steineri]|uniref:F-box domain-containing protein n=1 Tax=Adineta steineri TaxID=433720 RepID=A0A815K284_9BILA|nr:unnamed protein product [Adineta steineri]CAF3543567.1 unnamed protein product [Adineta steineri]
MENCMQLEDLSSELFCEIFDYLNAFDLFLAFASLNSRISSIIKLTRLHVIIDPVYCRSQIKFMSRHLAFHSDQIISLNIFDKICDQKNVVAYLFIRHDFPNLRLCVLRDLQDSSKLENVIKKLKLQSQMTSLHIFQTYYTSTYNICRSHAHLFSEMTLLNTPLTLRFATLLYHYDHSELTTTMTTNINLKYLHLIFYGEVDKITIYSLIPVLRVCNALRQLIVTIKNPPMSRNNHNINIPNFPYINEDDLPTISTLQILDLQIFTQCNIHSLNLILHCMPNLQELSLTLVNNHVNQWLIDSFINGNNWQRMLTSHVANLKVFDFHMSFLMDNRLLDSNVILNSFRYFVTHYNGWHMAISRWITFEDIGPGKPIVLQTLNYKSIVPRYRRPTIINIVYGTFETISTDISNTNDHKYQSNNTFVEFYMLPYMERQIIKPSSNIPFRNVNYLVIYLSFIEVSVISRLFKKISELSE